METLTAPSPPKLVTSKCGSRASKQHLNFRRQVLGPQPPTESETLRWVQTCVCFNLSLSGRLLAPVTFTCFCPRLCGVSWQRDFADVSKVLKQLSLKNREIILDYSSHMSPQEAEIKESRCMRRVNVPEDGEWAASGMTTGGKKQDPCSHRHRIPPT